MKKIRIFFLMFFTDDHFGQPAGHTFLPYDGIEHDADLYIQISLQEKNLL